MSIYLTCEGVVDFPLPGCEQLAAQVRVITRKGQPVTTQTLALFYDLPIRVMEQELRRTARLGWIRAAAAKDAWIAGEVRYYDDQRSIQTRGE